MSNLFNHPLGHLSQLYREIGTALGQPKTTARTTENLDEGSTGQWLPLVDVREDDTEFVLLADIPGVDPRDIEVSMDNRVLTIAGERSDDTGDGVQFRHSERELGRFLRRFAMPDTADPDQVSAKGENGVLEIVIKKRREQQPRRIPIDT